MRVAMVADRTSLPNGFFFGSVTICHDFRSSEACNMIGLHRSLVHIDCRNH
jgi:hypothetical protein